MATSITERNPRTEQQLRAKELVALSDSQVQVKFDPGEFCQNFKGDPDSRGHGYLCQDHPEVESDEDAFFILDDRLEASLEQQLADQLKRRAYRLIVASNHLVPEDAVKLVRRDTFSIRIAGEVRETGLSKEGAELYVKFYNRTGGKLKL